MRRWFFNGSLLYFKYFFFFNFISCIVPLGFLPWGIYDLRKRRGEHSVSSWELYVTATPPPSEVRSDKRESARRSVVCAERVKNHTHTHRVSFHFPLPIELLEIPQNYQTSPITLRKKYVFQEAERPFFGSINIFLSTAVWTLLSGNLHNFLFFWPLSILP